MKHRIILLSFCATFAMFFGCTTQDGVTTTNKPNPQLAAQPGPQDEDNPAGINHGCYVCHMAFADESLTRRHVRNDIGCVRCHGTSADHANDENIGATPPDIVYERDTVEPLCLDCHHRHRLSRKRAARWQERQKEQVRMHEKPVCTDCHARNHHIGEF